jgi:polysaccharide export outer membrane protein
MKKRVLFMILAIAGLACGASRAQQPAQNTSANGDPDVKPCVVVYGAVRSPARIELRRPVRLAEVIAIAGGLTEPAGDTVHIIHSRSKCFQPGINDRVVEVGNPPGELTAYALSEVLSREEKANPYLDAGDVVIVTQLAPIYVVGCVVTPRTIYSKTPVTLMQAMKLAGGALRDAQVSKVVVHRQNKDSGDLNLQFDFAAIRKHQAENPVLQPYDIVFVPSLRGPAFRLPPRYPTFDPRPLIPPPYRVIY